MIPPFVSFVAFNRMGLTARNLKALLETTDDFELHIIDSGSSDNTWDYIQSLSDRRIKSRERFEVNSGPIYAVNYNLSKRKPGQFFITIDSDVCMHTPNWIECFMRVFNTFPEVGLLGVNRAYPYHSYIPPCIKKEKGAVSYLRLAYGKFRERLDFVPGHCQCLRPELIDTIGYWNEECYFGDAEISARINNYTHYRAGFVEDINIDMLQSIGCGQCEATSCCKLPRHRETCFALRDKHYKNMSFIKAFEWKYFKYFEELEGSKRTVYSASIHDKKSIKNYIYHMDWALENFEYYRN